jgi:hypothetical protein
MKNNNQAGKGDRYRPVDKKKYDKNYESIKWNNDIKKINNKKFSSNN